MLLCCVSFFSALDSAVRTRFGVRSSSHHGRTDLPSIFTLVVSARTGEEEIARAKITTIRIGSSRYKVNNLIETMGMNKCMGADGNKLKLPPAQVAHAQVNLALQRPKNSFLIVSGGLSILNTPSTVPHPRMNTSKPKVASILRVLALKCSRPTKPTAGPYGETRHCVDRKNTRSLA